MWTPGLKEFTKEHTEIREQISTVQTTIYDKYKEPWKVREFGGELNLGEGLMGEGAVNSDDSEGALFSGVLQRHSRTA